MSLQAITNARNVPDDVRIYLDNCPEQRLDEVEFVRNTYLPTAEIHRSGPHVAALSGCWNILHALREGYHSGADYIFLIEEDVLVFPRYFEWSLKELSEGCYFATCGRSRPQFPGNYYTNPGACFPKESLRQIVPHINDHYFADRRGYLNRIFGELEGSSDLDDGLIRHVMRAAFGIVKYPRCPMVAHQGFRGYDKVDIYMNAGTNIQERIECLRSMLKRVSPNDRYAKDFEVFNP